MVSKANYDVIIIGAGIGGLVCGCYLAKAGLRVLIIEKNEKPGGYCTSFSRNGFSFDACVHFLGSLRDNGIVRKIMRELELENKIKILRNDPSDIIFSTDYNFSFWNNIDKTIKEIQKYFPAEKKSIEDFFHYILNISGYDFLELRDKTFSDLLNHYFDNEHLKALLGFPVLGNTGVSVNQVAAIKAVTLFKEFMFDGGYYIRDNVQVLPDTLTRRFKSYGGKILFNSPAKKIIVNNEGAKGVTTEKNASFFAKYVISNADAYHSFFDLIGRKYIPEWLQKTLMSLNPSLSMFALYLGVKNSIPQFPQHANVWYFSSYDLEKLYKYILKGDIKDIKWFLGYYDPDKNTALFFFNVPYISREYWIRNKERLAELLIDKVDKVIPNFSNNICYKNIATPDTMLRWTSNYQGAAYGWDGTVNQFSVSGLSQITPIKNFFLTGHWTTLVQGISGVIYLGMITAKTILRIKRIRS